MMSKKLNMDIVENTLIILLSLLKLINLLPNRKLSALPVENDGRTTTRIL